MSGCSLVRFINQMLNILFYHVPEADGVCRIDVLIEPAGDTQGHGVADDTEIGLPSSTGGLHFFSGQRAEEYTVPADVVHDFFAVRIVHTTILHYTFVSIQSL